MIAKSAPVPPSGLVPGVAAQAGAVAALAIAVLGGAVLAIVAAPRLSAVALVQALAREVVAGVAAAAGGVAVVVAVDGTEVIEIEGACEEVPSVAAARSAAAAAAAVAVAPVGVADVEWSSASRWPRMWTRFWIVVQLHASPLRYLPRSVHPMV